MPPSKTRFVTACQQVLALGAVFAVLAPAADVVSLDVVHEAPGTTPTGAPAVLSAYALAAQRPSLVPTAAVEPEVRELALTAPAADAVAGRAVAPARAAARVVAGAGSAPTAVTSTPAEVEGYGAIGVTWDPDAEVPDEDITVRARTSTDGVWSDWVDLEYHDEHGPDPDSPEAATARPGTDELLVGEVDEVQVQAVSARGPLPADMKLAVVDPGTPEDSEMERAAIDTGALAGEAPPTDAATEPATEPAEDGLVLQAARYTPRPVIYSRAQWGANEKLRDKGSLRFHEIHAGFVHHTVNANDYTSAEVPAIIRSIYAYHTQSRGWSDVGYNFLVDKFGRIWEGRAGGIDRPVVGAHTSGYNDYSFAMSAIGNFETAKPRQAMLEAYGALMGWKLSLHGVAAGSSAQRVGSKTFRAINGHRDAGSTACPGRYLYARIATIRSLAATAQAGWSGRELESNLVGTSHPDVVARRASDGRVFVLPTTGSAPAPVTPTRKLVGAGAYKALVATPDVTGDGRTDLIGITARGTGKVRPGRADGTFARAVRVVKSLRGHTLLSAVGDLNGDRRNDLVGRRGSDQQLVVFLGRGAGKFRARSLGASGRGLTTLSGAGDLDRDGRVELLGRTKDGSVWRYPTRTDLRLGPRVKVGTWASVRRIAGFGDYTGDGRADVFVQDAAGNGYVRPGRGNGTFRRAVGPISAVRDLRSLTGGGHVTGSGAADVLGLSGSRVVAVAEAGRKATGGALDTGLVLKGVNRLMNVGDWNRDGYGDIGYRTTVGVLEVRLGNGQGQFPGRVRLSTSFAKVYRLSAVGDMTGDGWPDLMGQPKGGSMMVYPGRGTSGIGAGYAAYSKVTGSPFVGVGRWDSDGAPDALVNRSGKAYVYRGNGPGGLTGVVSLGGSLAGYDRLVGISDATGDGHADLVAREARTGTLWLLPGVARGFGARQEIGKGTGIYDLMG